MHSNISYQQREHKLLFLREVRLQIALPENGKMFGGLFQNRLVICLGRKAQISGLNQSLTVIERER